MYLWRRESSRTRLQNFFRHCVQKNLRGSDPTVISFPRNFHSNFLRFLCVLLFLCLPHPVITSICWHSYRIYRSSPPCCRKAVESIKSQTKTEFSLIFEVRLVEGTFLIYMHAHELPYPYFVADIKLHYT